MMYYLLRRVFLLTTVLLGLSLLAFSLSYLFPGDPVQNFSGLQFQDEQQRQAIIQAYKLDQSYFQQYSAFLSRLWQGELGLSLASQQPLLQEIRQVLPATIELTSYALIVAFVFGIPLGLIAGLKADTWLGKSLSASAMIGYSLPIFWWALLLLMIFAVGLGWFPSGGRLGVLYQIPAQTGFLLPDILMAEVSYRGAAFHDALRHLFLPTLVLATYPTTVMIRFVRDAILSVWEQNYIKTARAKGLSRSQVLFRHGLRNALLPVIREIGLLFSTLITLAMLTEVVFSWPGIGRWLIDSIYQRNYPAIQAGLMIISVLVIMVNMLTEILHTLFNPLARKR